MAEMNHPFVRAAKRALASFCALMFFPAMIGALFFLDQAYKVVREFRVVTQVVTPEGVLIEGVMDKQRSCRFIEIVAMLDEIPSRVVFLDTREKPAFSRPTGPQKCGPWLIVADPKQGVKLHARHHCHAGWEHTEVLTSFVVGVQ